MTLRVAQRQKAKIRLGISAVSGAGKTYSALLMAYGMTGDWSKIAIIDSENGSADLYSHLGNYNVLTIEAPYTPENYIKAIKTCEDVPTIELIIVDSITHEWSGKGGILEIHGAMTGNSFTNWATVTPRHQKFIDAILQSRCHMITTVRRKTDYEMSKDSNGKMVIEKGGLKEVTREDFEYELTINLQLDTAHLATASKDRTELFMDKPAFVPSIETGKLLRDWCENGIEPIKPDPEKDLKSAKNLVDLQAVYLSLNDADKQKYKDLATEIKADFQKKIEEPIKETINKIDKQTKNK